MITINEQTRITKASDALQRIKNLPEFRQGYVLGKLDEMVDAERRRQETEGKQQHN